MHGQDSHETIKAVCPSGASGIGEGKASPRGVLRAAGHGPLGKDTTGRSGMWVRPQPAPSRRQSMACRVDRRESGRPETGGHPLTVGVVDNRVVSLARCPALDRLRARVGFSSAFATSSVAANNCRETAAVGQESFPVIRILHLLPGEIAGQRTGADPSRPLGLFCQLSSGSGHSRSVEGRSTRAQALSARLAFSLIQSGFSVPGPPG